MISLGRFSLRPVKKLKPQRGGVRRGCSSVYSLRLRTYPCLVFAVPLPQAKNARLLAKSIGLEKYYLQQNGAQIVGERLME